MMITQELTTVLDNAGWYDKFNDYLAEGLTDGRQYVALDSLGTMNGPSTLMARPFAFLMKKNPFGLGGGYFIMTLKTSVMLDDREVECSTPEIYTNACENLLNTLPPEFRDAATKISPVRVGLNLDVIVPVVTDKTEQSDIIKAHIDEYLTTMASVFSTEFTHREAKAMALTEAVIHQLIGLQLALSAGAASPATHASH